MELREYYQQSIAQHEEGIAWLKRWDNTFVVAELFSFGCMSAFLVCWFALADYVVWLCLAAVSLAAYFLVRLLDDRFKSRIEEKMALVSHYRKELRALAGDFSAFESGEQYIASHHPYTFDLDVFGKDSLYQRICRTITTGGSDCLAQMLARTEPLAKEELGRIVELQEELAAKLPDGESAGEQHERLEQRRRLMALGELHKGKVDTEAVVAAVRKVAGLQVPHFFGSKLVLLMAWLLMVGIVVSVVLSVVGFVSPNVPLFWMMAQFMGIFFLCKSTLDKMSQMGERLRSHLQVYAQILVCLSCFDFRSEKGREMQQSLADALPSFHELGQILKAYDRRGNFLGLFFTDAFMLSDFFLVRKFLRWKGMYVDRMEEWMQTVSELDAHLSAANFRFNHPEAVDANIVDGREVVYEAKGLYHPFLGQKAVKNDFRIKDTHYYIITGANMAGKSTFLRSLGVNYVLAMAGLPVFADSLRVSRFRLFSSMRTSDDLTHGISYFNAELLRLKLLMEYCKKETDQYKTLIILDEILKGTNSLDKLNGSRLFLETVSRLPVSGVVATHDLELSKMEEMPGGRFHNYCFEIDLGTDVTYTYQIQPGVARNQNATFLLDKILKCFA